PIRTSASPVRADRPRTSPDPAPGPGARLFGKGNPYPDAALPTMSFTRSEHVLPTGFAARIARMVTPSVTMPKSAFRTFGWKDSS
ncbi:MAG: hypothetical protein QMC36_08185, partial [Patescibacteria group bacterium]